MCCHTIGGPHRVAIETDKWEAKVGALGEAARAEGYKGPEHHVVAIGDNKVGG